MATTPNESPKDADAKEEVRTPEADARETDINAVAKMANVEREEAELMLEAWEQTLEDEEAEGHADGLEALMEEQEALSAPRIPGIAPAIPIEPERGGIKEEVRASEADAQSGEDYLAVERLPQAEAIKVFVVDVHCDNGLVVEANLYCGETTDFHGQVGNLWMCRGLVMTILPPTRSVEEAIGLINQELPNHELVLA